MLPFVLYAEVTAQVRAQVRAQALHSEVSPLTITKVLLFKSSRIFEIKKRLTLRLVPSSAGPTEAAINDDRRAQPTRNASRMFTAFHPVLYTLAAHHGRCAYPIRLGARVHHIRSLPKNTCSSRRPFLSQERTPLPRDNLTVVGSVVCSVTLRVSNLVSPMRSLVSW